MSSQVREALNDRDEDERPKPLFFRNLLPDRPAGITRLFFLRPVQRLLPGMSTGLHGVFYQADRS